MENNGYEIHSSPGRYNPSTKCDSDTEQDALLICKTDSRPKDGDSKERLSNKTSALKRRNRKRKMTPTKQDKRLTKRIKHHDGSPSKAVLEIHSSPGRFVPLNDQDLDLEDIGRSLSKNELFSAHKLGVKQIRRTFKSRRKSAPAHYKTRKRRPDVSSDEETIHEIQSSPGRYIPCNYSDDDSDDGHETSVLYFLSTNDNDSCKDKLRCRRNTDDKSSNGRNKTAEKERPVEKRRSITSSGKTNDLGKSQPEGNLTQKDDQLCPVPRREEITSKPSKVRSQRTLKENKAKPKSRKGPSKDMINNIGMSGVNSFPLSCVLNGGGLGIDGVLPLFGAQGILTGQNMKSWKTIVDESENG